VKPTRLLFVDDEPGIRATLPPILRRYGFVVAVAASVREGLEQIRKQEFDVLLCDLKFQQDADGYEIVRVMRQANPDCIIVVLTGNPTMEPLSRALNWELTTLLPSLPLSIILLQPWPKSCAHVGLHFPKSHGGNQQQPTPQLPTKIAAIRKNSKFRTSPQAVFRFPKYCPAHPVLVLEARTFHILRARCSSLPARSRSFWQEDLPIERGFRSPAADRISLRIPEGSRELPHTARKMDGGELEHSK